VFLRTGYKEFGDFTNQCAKPNAAKLHLPMVPRNYMKCRQFLVKVTKQPQEHINSVAMLGCSTPFVLVRACQLEVRVPQKDANICQAMQM